MRRPWSDGDVLLAAVRVMAGEEQFIDLADGDWLRAQGREHGYPDCCIEAFVEDYEAGRMPAELRGVHENGHVACSKCVAEAA